MNSKTFFGFLLVAVLAATGGWFAAKHWGHRESRPVPASGGRKVLYYQSAMHPWIKSDKPGKCTICGMELAPVYEGERGFDVAEGLVSLSSNSINVVHVQTAEVRRRPLQRALRVAGVIEENDSRHRILAAYVDGRIDGLHVNYIGAEVEQGQPLATLYSPTLLNVVREYVALYRQHNFSPSLEVQQVNERLVAAGAQRLRQLGLTPKQIETLPQRREQDIHMELIAPMSGTVVARNVYEGQYVKEGDKLFEMADFSTMWFQFDAYERDLAWIKTGDKVEVTTPAVPGKVYSGSVTFIDPNIREMTRTARLRVEIANPIIDESGRKRRELFHKLYADGVVKVDFPETLAVPRSAVLSPGQQPVVYVDKDEGTYEQRRVKLGRAGDDFWEILEGLSEGERVVTTGNLLIDAQAQLNQTSDQRAPAQETTRSAEVAPALSDAQHKTVQEFLELVAAVTKALSSDKLDAFNEQATKVHAAVPELLKPFENAKAWHPLLQKIEATGHLEAASDLAAARKSFFPFSQAVVEFVRRLRLQETGFDAVKIYQCPMASQAIPGAPKVGFWIQTQSPLQNPFFGAEMLDCGTEVK